MIPQRNLSLLSNRLARGGGRRIPESVLAAGIDRKLEARGRARAGMGEELARKVAAVRKLWEARLGTQLAHLPPFDEVYRAVRRALRSSGLLER